MPTTTEAWVARPNSELNLETVSYPSLADDEVFVDIVAAAVCHSDIKAADGTFHLKPPLILGHEGAGRVREVGKNVTYVRPGDAVILAFASCGVCRRCKVGKEPYCDALFHLNFATTRQDGGAVVQDEKGEAVHGQFFGQSSMSRLALVRERSCVKVDDASDKELRLFASLGCGVQTGAGAILNVARPEEGASIAVFGGGAVGLSAIMAARLTKPAVIVLVDNSDAKLEMIPKQLLKGVTVVNSRELSHDELVAKLKSLTPNNRGLDYALDGVGHEAVLNAAYESLDKMGTVLVVGGSPTAQPKYRVERSLVNGIMIRGTHQGDSVPRIMIPSLIQMWRDGSFPFDQLLTQFKFEDLHKALDEMHAGKVIKPLLVT
jgi:aryl-alcohol dehydrogenase